MAFSPDERGEGLRTPAPTAAKSTEANIGIAVLMKPPSG
jgi:hypothetical protein